MAEPVAPVEAVPRRGVQLDQRQRGDIGGGGDRRSVQAGAGQRIDDLGEQQLGTERRPAAGAVEDGEVVVGHRGFVDLVAGVQVDGERRVRAVEAEQAGEQPELRHRVGAQHADAVALVGGADARRGALQPLQGDTDLGVEGRARRGQADAARLALEQGDAEAVLEGADLLAHRALGQVQLGGGAGEAAVATHRLEGDQGFQRRQMAGVAAHGDLRGWGRGDPR
ncbi:hypothetical protein D3C85_269470 [compost metagenome]